MLLRNIKPSLPSHLLRVLSPRRPWRRHHWLKCKLVPAHLYPSSPQLAAQTLAGESKKQSKNNHVNHGKTISAHANGRYRTLEQPGVKAPGTANRTPFFPLKSWSIETLFLGSPSWTSTAGRESPTWGGGTHTIKLNRKPWSLLPIYSI